MASGRRAAYVGGVAALALAGDTRSLPLVVAAVVLTLPTGILALAGVYVIYGLLLVVAHAANATVMTGNGWNPTWFVVVDELLVTVLFAAAALANARLIGNAVRRSIPPPGP